MPARHPPTGPRPVTALVAAATLATTLGLTAACSAGGTGTRDEGPAHTAPAGQAAASPVPDPSDSASAAVRRVDPVRLVMTDHQVSPEVKKGLRPCVSSGYPVDVSYGRLTGSATDDVVVNVMTCDAVGVGSYVYRAEGRRYEDVFLDEEPPVYAEIDRGDLVVTQKVYEKGDQLAYPSSEDVITYHWSASEDRFTEQDRTHNDYSNAVGGDKPTTSEN